MFDTRRGGATPRAAAAAVHSVHLLACQSAVRLSPFPSTLCHSYPLYHIQSSLRHSYPVSLLSCSGVCQPHAYYPVSVACTVSLTCTLRCVSRIRSSLCHFHGLYPVRSTLPSLSLPSPLSSCVMSIDITQFV